MLGSGQCKNVLPAQQTRQFYCSCRLGFFERKHGFYNKTQLTGEIARHYSQQAIKQMYVLVLGLDVLGNPFGVIRGIATGIEDLFYEPYQVRRFSCGSEARSSCD